MRQAVSKNPRQRQSPVSLATDRQAAGNLQRIFGASQ